MEGPVSTPTPSAHAQKAGEETTVKEVCLNHFNRCIPDHALLIIAETFDYIILVPSVVAGFLAAIIVLIILIIIVKKLRKKLSLHKDSTNTHEMMQVANVAYGVVRVNSAEEHVKDNMEYEEIIDPLPRKWPNDVAIQPIPDPEYETIFPK